MDRDTSRRLYEELKNKDDPDRAELEAWFREYERWRIKSWHWLLNFGRRDFRDDLRDWLFRRWLGLR
jgi:hypothetical protein